jgi:hypothetical protein
MLGLRFITLLLVGVLNLMDIRHVSCLWYFIMKLTPIPINLVSSLHMLVFFFLSRLRVYTYLNIPDASIIGCKAIRHLTFLLFEGLYIVKSARHYFRWNGKLVFWDEVRSRFLWFNNIVYGMNFAKNWTHEILLSQIFLIKCFSHVLPLILYSARAFQWSRLKSVIYHFRDNSEFPRLRIG